jgi:uncharacterized protein with HEPN domain
MLDQARTARAKIHGVARSEFDRDENLRMTLAYLIQTIGEAARRVSPSFQRAHPDVPWSRVVGIRHRIVHDYLHVDYDIVWDVVQADLPGPIQQLEEALPPEQR